MACKGIMVMFSNTKHCNWFSQPCVVAVTSLSVDILTTLTHYEHSHAPQIIRKCYTCTGICL